MEVTTVSQVAKYSVALEQQFELMRRIKANKVRGTHYSYMNMGLDGDWSVPQTDINNIAIAPGTERREWDSADSTYRNASIEVLELAKPFYVSSQISRMLEDAAWTLPESTTIYPTDLPDIDCFFWLEEPHGIALPGRTPGGYQHFLKCFQVLATNARKSEAREPGPKVDILAWGYSTQPERSMLKIKGRIINDWAYLNDLGMQVIDAVNGDTVAENKFQNWLNEIERQKYENTGEVPYSYFDSEPPYIKTASIPVQEYEANLNQHYTAIRRFVFALLHFINQPIQRTSLHAVDRATRRRLPAQWMHDPVINVVTLRDVHYVNNGHESEPSGREYSHRWIVRGHWRNQWYPSENRHKPKWISPYVKGPDNTPITGGTKLFAVTR